MGQTDCFRKSIHSQRNRARDIVCTRSVVSSPMKNFGTSAQSAAKGKKLCIETCTASSERQHYANVHRHIAYARRVCLHEAMRCCLKPISWKADFNWIPDQ